MLVVCADRSTLQPHVEDMLVLHEAGAVVRVAYVEGERPGGLAPIGQQRRLDATRTASTSRRRVLAVASRVAGRRRLLLGAKFDPWFRKAARSADVVLLADEDSTRVRPVLGQIVGDVPVIGPAEVAAALTTLVHQARFRTAVGSLDPELEGEDIDIAPLMEALTGLQGAPLPLPPGSGLPTVTAVVAQLVRAARHREVRALVGAASRVPGIDVDRLGLTALDRSSQISLGAAAPDDLGRVVGDTLEAADAALDAGDVQHAVDVTTAALRLIFHRDMHADVPYTPLVDDPAGYLEPLQHSRVMELMRSTSPRRTRIVDDGGHREGPTRILVLPGAYPKFSPPLIGALRDAPGAEVRVLDLGRHDRVFRWLGINARAVGIRLRHALGEEVQAGKQLLTELDWADVVVADWADRGAMWASLMVPEGTRLIVRVHSMDSLSPWLQLIDWTRVDDAVFVSAPIRQIAVDALGERLVGTRLHTIGNGIDLDRFAPPAGDPPRSDRVLGMVGWSRPVKDPLFALEVLASLLEREPGWRLVLVGPDLEIGTVEQINAYSRQVRERAMRDDVRQHIQFVPETKDVPRYVRTFGFILSTSVRESFHSAVVEGVAAGAVPVIRNWPILARRDGARSIYPADWVIETPQEAVERIWAHRDTEVRTAAAAEALTVLRERFALETFAARIRALVLDAQP